MSYAYVPDPFVWMDPLGLIQIGRLGSAIAEAFAGPAVGGIEHAPLHAHLKDGASKTRVLMEDYYKKGKLVGI